MHPTRKTQIRILLFVKNFTTILVKYFNYNNIFLAENITELLEHTKINNYITKLENNK